MALHGPCNSQNFNCCISVIILYTKLSCMTLWCWFTLQTTLMPSISSALRILIWDVPFMVCSDSDIPASSDELVNWWAVKYTDTHLPTKASYYHSNIWTSSAYWPSPQQNLNSTLSSQLMTTTQPLLTDKNTHTHTVADPVRSGTWQFGNDVITNSSC